MPPLTATIDLSFLIASLAKIVVIVFMVLLPMVAYSVYAERRGSAVIQDRVGPNRTGIPLTLFGFKHDVQIFGIGGLLQPMADGLKFILKEDFTPGHVKKFYYWIAPMLVMVPALVTVGVLPFGSELDLPSMRPIPLVIADLNVGPLFAFAIASLGVYGIVLAGWASNSKYPFLGGVRSSSQMISYEIALGLSIVPVLMIFGDLNLSKIDQYQDQNGWLLAPLWGHGWTVGRWVLLIPISISFVIFVVSMFAETNRAPFDLPECETELVAGYHTEYSSMKFALFFLGEYAAMIIGSGMAVTLFLGGWSLPLSGGLTWLFRDVFHTGISFQYQAGATPIWLSLLQMFCFFVKVVLFILGFIWVRWTLPRFRYDQLMRLGWLVFFEVALANVFLTGALLIWFHID